ncbi:DUF4402 domain-containing protein [Sneathiella marina]|uniref:DUF4402 domain-containing protein n=1 Tax=Sneathiella marina TaxID=2950108 RepID=A0ABY4VXW1_9PROT|nr:DUF4402 domain-containing protein [Sneathiella marina]USG59750.1 DUF4402 domain-containing protein [Sneathiella marina]
MGSQAVFKQRINKGGKRVAKEGGKMDINEATNERRALIKARSLNSFYGMCGILILNLGSVASARAEEATDNPVAIKLVKPLAIEEISLLSFGWLVIDTSLTTHTTVDFSGDSRYPDGYLLAPSVSSFGSPQLGVFKITGSPDEAVTVTMTKGGDLNDEDRNTLTVIGIVPSRDNGSTLDSDGELFVKSGIIFSHSPLQPPGIYRGTYTVTVVYP